VAPLAKWILSSGYFEAVFALVLSVAAAALVVVMTRAAFNAFREGDKGFDKTHRRRDNINRVIDGV
jgi:zinc transporter ZupT